MAKANAWIILGVIALIALVGLGSYAMFYKPVAQTAVGGTGVGGGSAGGVNVYTSALSLSYAGTDKLQTGTAVGVSVYKRAKGDARFALATNPENVNQGDVYEVLFVNNTAYHNIYIPEFTVPAGNAKTLEAQLLGNASITIRVFNTDSQRMTDGGGVNQTVASGGAYNLQVWFDGQDKKSTQDMVCVLEGSDSTKIDKLTLNGASATFKGMAKPSSYTLSSVNSGVWVYDVAPVTNAVSQQFTLGTSSKTGQSMAGETFKIACFPKEYFIDPITGNVEYAIEDSNGLLKSMTSYTFTGYFQ